MSSSTQRMSTQSRHYFATLNLKIKSLRAAGHDVIRLDIGSPDMPPPSSVIKTLSRSAARADAHGYGEHSGTPALRRAWAGMYRRLYEVALDPESEVVPLLGSKEGIFHMTQALIEPGDLVLIPDPCYPTYLFATQFTGGEPYSLPLLPERDFLPDLSSIPGEIAWRAKILWLNYPNNPTAATAPLEFFAQAVAFASRHNILLCHDAAYTQVTFNGYQAPSILQIPGAKDVAVEFNTLSKSHNMAGWRVGAAVGNPLALRALYNLKTNLDSGHFLPILETATYAMTSAQGWLAKRNLVYQRRRDLLVEALNTMGLHPRTPEASLYVWSPVPEGWTSMDFATALLEDTHVSITPGVVFGSHGEGYVRISISSPDERLAEALRRITSWWEKI